MTTTKPMTNVRVELRNWTGLAALLLLFTVPATHGFGGGCATAVFQEAQVDTGFGQGCATVDLHFKCDGMCHAVECKVSCRETWEEYSNRCDLLKHFGEKCVHNVANCFYSKKRGTECQHAILPEPKGGGTDDSNGLKIVSGGQLQSCNDAKAKGECDHSHTSTRDAIRSFCPKACDHPTGAPTDRPTHEPTHLPTQEPTHEPTHSPTEDPTTLRVAAPARVQSRRRRRWGRGDQNNQELDVGTDHDLTEEDDVFDQLDVDLQTKTAQNFVGGSDNLQTCGKKRKGRWVNGRYAVDASDGGCPCCEMPELWEDKCRMQKCKKCVACTAKLPACPGVPHKRACHSEENDIFSSKGRAVEIQIGNAFGGGTDC